MNLTHLTSSDLAKIAKLFKKKEFLLERLAKVDAKLSAFEGGAGPAKPAGKARRKISAAGRARIAAAQRKRWTKRAGKKKRKMSAAGRRAIAAAQRKRWAKIKAAKSQ